MRIQDLLVRAFGAWMFVAAGVAAAAPPVPPELKLPETVVPAGYELKLTVDPDADAYAGTMDIALRIAAPTDLVWINATGLELADVRAVVDPARAGGLPGTVVPGNEDVVGLQFASPLPAGEVRLSMRFTGRFSTGEVAGLFRQKDAGDWYVLTQMEPMYARRAFPCFDEPRFRATWRIVLTVPEAQRAFSNMPVEGERAGKPGWREVSFKRSPPMASYLVALAIGPWDVLEGGTAGRNATPLRYIAPKGRAAEAAYAASITPRIVERLEAYFGQPFPFPKLDSIAIPNSGHFFGAMENIGLISYDQSLLLATPAATTKRFEQNYVGTAAHEIAHQWFGDLVTPVWWNDIWLNESFATWLGNKITDEVKPEWQWDYQRVGRRQWAILNDRLASARRIRQPIEARSDVRSAFDGISYAKGATVLAMFEDWLGSEKFQAGVRRYMAKYAWGVASAEDFFAALAAEDDAVLPAFRGFVDRPGVPLLAIALDCAGSPRLTLSQSRFLPKGSTGDPEQHWVFPACFQYGGATGSKTQCTLVKDETSELALDTPACPRWVVGNRAAIGYFLPALSPALYADLPKAAAALNPMEWFAVLADTNLLARSAAVPLPEALALAAFGSKQEEPHVYGEALAIADSVPRALTPGASGNRYASWVLAQFGRRARALGWQPRADEDAETQQLRRQLVPFVADRGGDAKLASEARDRAMRWPQDQEAVPQAVRGALLYTAARTAQDDARALYAHLAAAAKSASVAAERRDLLRALGGFRDPSIVRDAAALVLAGPFDAQESLIILSAQLENEATRLSALAWIDANYDALWARGAQDSFAELPGWAAGGCSTDERARFVAVFAQRMPKVDGGPRSYTKALERIDLCLAYRAAQEPALAKWLAAGAKGE